MKIISVISTLCTRNFLLDFCLPLNFSSNYLTIHVLSSSWRSSTIVFTKYFDLFHAKTELASNTFTGNWIILTLKRSHFCLFFHENSSWHHLSTVDTFQIRFHEIFSTIWRSNGAISSSFFTKYFDLDNSRVLTYEAVLAGFSWEMSSAHL